jgi:dienelactone hydrolase
MHTLASLDPANLPALSDWPTRRPEIERTWRSYLGPLPESAPVTWRSGDEAVADGVRRQRIRYQSPDDEVSAYLLTPDPAPTAPAPAVLALHQTVTIGKDEVVGLGGSPDLAYGLELAQRGYVVLAPDTITRGERIADGEKPDLTDGFYRRNPTWTAVGRMLVDHRQGVDLLASLPIVDARRIGAIGHSLGGYNAYFLAGLDERIAAAVVSCGFGMFAADPRPDRWCRDDFFNHIPRLRHDLDAGLVPWEWHEILALAAPRPLMVWWTTEDRIFPNAEAVEAGVEEVARLYSTLSHGDDFLAVRGECGHSFPDHARRRAYKFLDQHLT